MTPIRHAPPAAILLTAVAAAGCTYKVKVDPIKVEPIDITLRIFLEADQKLDSFFNFQEPAAAESTSTPAAEVPPPSEGGMP